MTDTPGARFSTLALLALAGVNIIWGCAFPLTKPALQDIPPFSFALLRFLLALAVLLPVCARQALPMLLGPDRWRVIAAGLLGFTLAQTGQTVGLALAPASDIALLATLAPIVVMLLAWAWLGERPSSRIWWGLVLSLAGLILILWPNDHYSIGHDSRVLGDMIFLIQPISWGAYNVMGRALTQRHAPLPVVTAAGLVGTVGLLPLAATEWARGEVPHFTVISVAALCYTALLVTALGFLVLYWALKQLPAARTAMLMYLQPLAGVLLAWAWLGEPLTLPLLGGGALVLLGVGIVVFVPRRVTTLAAIAPSETPPYTPR